jgi:hypothetical protein
MVLQARREAIEVQIDRLDIETELARVWARLEFLSPRAVAEVASPSPPGTSQRPVQ